MMVQAKFSGLEKKKIVIAKVNQESRQSFDRLVEEITAFRWKVNEGFSERGI